MIRPPQPKRVALLHLCRPYVVKEFNDSYQKLLEHDRWQNNHIGGREGEPRVLSQKCPPYPDLFRNMLTLEAFKRWSPDPRKPGLDVIFWLDDDMGFLPPHFDRIVAALDPVKRPIVSGLYFATEAGRCRPLVNRPTDTPDGVETVWRYPEDQLVGNQMHVGMGFCGICVEPLLRWADEHGPTWFDRMKNARGQHMIEDSSFCTRMRQLGCEIFVDTGVKLDHWKTAPINERTYRAQIALEEKEAV